MTSDFTFCPDKKATSKNKILFYIKNSCIYIALLFSGGTLMQTFLKTSGISDELIGIFTMALNIASSFAILCGVTFFDKIKNRKRFLSVSVLMMVCPFVILSPMCFLGISTDIVFKVAFVTCVLQNLFLGCRNVLEYKFIYLIIDMRDYSKVVSVDSIVSGIVGIALTAAFSAIIGIFDYRILMGVMFLLSAVALVIASLCNSSMKIVNPISETTTQKSNAKNMKLILKFILPSSFRGFAQGGIALLTLVGFSDGGLNEQTAAILALTATVASISGGALYYYLIKFFSPRSIELATQLIIAVLLPIMIIGKTPIVFIPVFFIIQLCLICASFAIPVMITKFVPFDIMGRFTSMRMLMMTISTAAANALTGLLIGKIPSIIILSVLGVFIAGSGIMHYTFSSPYLKSTTDT